MVNIFKKVEKFVNEKELIKDGDKILLGISGGPDSIFLFYFFLYLLNKKNIDIKVAYIHHHLREEADKEVEFVKRLAEKFNIEFFREDIEIEKKKNIERILREKRYEKLYKIAEETNCNKIATGHTLDDNVETIIMNFLRGSGLSGLCGIWPENKIILDSKITVIRPLLSIEKKEIIEYLKTNKIEYLIDSSNLSLSFFRNKIRNEIIPFLLKYNPSLKRQILKMISIIQEEEKFLKNYTEKVYKEVVKEDKGKLRVAVEKFNLLEISIKRRIAGFIYKAIKKTPYLNFRIVEKIKNELEKGREYIDKEILENILEQKKEKIEPFFYKINVPGKTEILNNIQIKTEFIGFSEEIFKNKDKYIGYFDWTKIKGDIIARNRKIGDKFVPLGFNKNKKVSRFMIDKKIPKNERDKVIIFENNGKIMWICGYEISEEFKVEKNTEKILKISVRAYKLNEEHPLTI